MATVDRFVQTANTHPSVPGGNPGNGGGLGSSVSPFFTMAQINTEVIGGSASDDLVLHCHPAAVFTSSAANLQVWDDLGRASGYRSITFQRWAQKIVDTPGLADWYPGTDTLVYPADGSFTEGSITGSTWSAGTGDVFRISIATANLWGASAAGNLRCWGGRLYGDRRLALGVTMYGVCCGTLDYVTEAGDYALADNGSGGTFLYIKTGATSVKPTARWGAFSWHQASGPGSNSFFLRNPKRFRTIDWLSCGGTVWHRPNSANKNNDQCSYIRPKVRLTVGNGLQFINTRDQIQFTTAPLSGSVSGTLTAVFAGSTNTYFITFGNSEQRTATLTNGSATVNWSAGGGALTSDARNDYAGYGLTATDTGGTWDCFVNEPDMHSGQHPTKPDKNIQTERNGQDGVQALGNVGSLASAATIDALVASGWYGTLQTGQWRGGFGIRNPKIVGFSHGGFVIGPDKLTTSNLDTFPNNAQILCDDVSDGKCVITGGPNYQRGFGFLVPVNGTIGPLTITEQSTQSQVGGNITIRNPLFINCTNGQDPLNATGGGKYNNGTHWSCLLYTSDAADDM
jgi:hypothetical protein